MKRYIRVLAVLVSGLWLACVEAPTGLDCQLEAARGIGEEATVECDSMTIGEAREFLEEKGVLDALEGQGWADEQFIETAFLICTGQIRVNPNL